MMTEMKQILTLCNKQEQKECNKQAQKEYKIRHNWLGNEIH